MAGRAEIGVDIWASGEGPVSRAGWPKQEPMLGWKGRLKARFVFDMATMANCSKCTFRSEADDGNKYSKSASETLERALPPLACH